MDEGQARFVIGSAALILLCVVGWMNSSTGSAEVEVDYQPTRELPCAVLYPPDPDRVWDEELEEYVPINWDWRECMGVGEK